MQDIDIFYTEYFSALKWKSKRESSYDKTEHPSLIFYLKSRRNGKWSKSNTKTQDTRLPDALYTQRAGNETTFGHEENETFVDVGANVGSYSLMVANDYRSSAVKVIAIEAIRKITRHYAEISNAISLRMSSYRSTRSFQIVMG